MADWSILERDYSCYDYYPYYQEKEQNAPAPCAQQPFNSPSPTLTLLLSPPPQCYQPPKGENPREIRNKAEKQRRDKMNQSVLRLASIVPTVAKPGRKLNKTSVLRLAAHYLRSHQHVFGSSIDRGPEFSFKFTETLLKNLKGFLITTTYKGIVVVVSPNVQEYLGYTELELLGQNVFNIVHKDDHQILREQLYPRSCTLTQRGEILIPKEVDAERKIADALANERRSFVIRFRKLSQQRSEPPQYVACHVEGSLRKADHAGSRREHIVHMGRRARSRGENISSSGNDVVFVGMVRPTAETFVTDGVLESFRMEYRTRHSIDGEIIQCEQRIALVTGYMTHEVSGVNAMNFMHRDDVRWVIIALREMYDQHRLVGESCYRLMTKNGQFIYMRTLGRLDVDQNSKAVTSFVCTNTVVAEQEGKQLIKLMKKKFTLMINNNEESKDEEELSEPENEKQAPPVEDPKQLEKVILHLVTDLPSPRPDDGQNQVQVGKGESSSHLAIIPPKKEKIHEAIEKSYSVIRSCCSTMVGKKRKNNKNISSPPTPNDPLSNQENCLDLNSFVDAFQVNLPQVSNSYSWMNSSVSNRPIDTIANISEVNTGDHIPQNITSLPARHFSYYVDNWNSVSPEPPESTCVYTCQSNANNDFNDLLNLSNSLQSDFLNEMLSDGSLVSQGDIPNPVNLPPPSASPYPTLSRHLQSPLSPLLPDVPPERPQLTVSPQSPVLPQSPVPSFLPVHPQPPVSPLSPVPDLLQVTSHSSISSQSSELPKQPEALSPHPSTVMSKSKNTCYNNSALSNAGVKRNNEQEKSKDQVKKIKINGELQMPKEIEEMITRELSFNAFLERKGRLPTHNILTEGELERILESVEQVDGISSRNFNDIFHFLQDSGIYYEEPLADEKDQEKPKEDEEKCEEADNNGPTDIYEFKDKLTDSE